MYIDTSTCQQQVHSTIDSFFFFNDPPTTEIYTLSLHDALPIWRGRLRKTTSETACCGVPLRDSSTWKCLRRCWQRERDPDRKSTRLNSVTVKSRMPSSA